MTPRNTNSVVSPQTRWTTLSPDPRAFLEREIIPIVKQRGWLARTLNPQMFRYIRATMRDYDICVEPVARWPEEVQEFRRRTATYRTYLEQHRDDIVAATPEGILIPQRQEYTELYQRCGIILSKDDPASCEQIRRVMQETELMYMPLIITSCFNVPDNQWCRGGYLVQCARSADIGRCEQTDWFLCESHGATISAQERIACFKFTRVEGRYNEITGESVEADASVEYAAKVIYTEDADTLYKWIAWYWKSLVARAGREE
jgi:hypothetical protein